MQTNRDIIQRVQSRYSHGLQSRSSRLSNRHIFVVLRTVRARLLSQEAKKNQRLSRFVYQVLPCIQLIEAPLNECSCVPQSGCVVLKSVYPIPSYLFNASKGLITVSGLDGYLTISETSYENQKYKKGSKYASNKPSFYIRNQFLYVTANTRLETVTMEGVFADPIEASLFPSQCGGVNTNLKCKSYLDFEFPYEEDQEDALVALAAEELIGEFNKSQNDTKNDTQDKETQRQG